MPLDENGNEIELEATLESPEPVSESMDETVRRSILEVGANELEKEGKSEEIPATVSEETPKEVKDEESEATKAAKTLAALKNKAKTGQKLSESGSKKRVVEASELEPLPEKKAAPAQVKERLDPPQRFPLDRKEWFNKQPRPLQEQILKDYSEIEGNATKVFQNAKRYESEAQNVAGQLGSVLDVVKQHAPNWAKRGITPANAILESSQLIADIHADPIDAIHALCQKAGVTAEQLYQYRNTGVKQGAQPNVAQQQPEKKYLTAEDVDRIYAERQQKAQGDAVIQELAKLQNTVTQDGRYLYPELHDGGSIERLKPLTERARKNQPGASWTDWTKQAIVWDRSLQNAQGLPSSSSVGLSGGNSNTTNLQEIKRASLSTKQRGAPSVPTIANGKANEKMDDTVRRSIAEARAKAGG